MMMGVDEEVDLPRAHLLEIAQGDLCRVRELRIDDDEAIRGHEHPDRAAAAGENADVAAQRIEGGLRRRRRRRHRRRLAERMRQGSERDEDVAKKSRRLSFMWSSESTFYNARHGPA